MQWIKLGIGGLLGAVLTQERDCWRDLIGWFKTSLHVFMFLISGKLWNEIWNLCGVWLGFLALLKLLNINANLVIMKHGGILKVYYKWCNLCKDYCNGSFMLPSSFDFFLIFQLYIKKTLEMDFLNASSVWKPIQSVDSTLVFWHWV